MVSVLVLWQSAVLSLEFLSLSLVHTHGKDKERQARMAAPGASVNEAAMYSASARESLAHTLAVHQGPSWAALGVPSEENETAAGQAQVCGTTRKADERSMTKRLRWRQARTSGWASAE